MKYDYDIIEAEHKHDLIYKINEKREQGYKLAGGISVCVLFTMDSNFGNQISRTLYSQAIYMDDIK